MSDSNRGSPVPAGTAGYTSVPPARGAGIADVVSASDLGYSTSHPTPTSLGLRPNVLVSKANSCTRHSFRLARIHL